VLVYYGQSSCDFACTRVIILSTLGYSNCLLKIISCHELASQICSNHRFQYTLEQGPFHPISDIRERQLEHVTFNPLSLKLGLADASEGPDDSEVRSTSETRLSESFVLQRYKAKDDKPWYRT
jgi:hypothetical protein